MVSQSDRLLRPSSVQKQNEREMNYSTVNESESPSDYVPTSQPPSPWLRKPPGYKDPHSSKSNSNSNKSLERHLSLWDLISIGLGGTIGSGIFVLCGMIAHEYAGPATFISWAIAGLAASFSGLCYAELAGTFPSSGSSYAYAYVSMGELPAVLAAACLTLEFTFSASAVARSWGDKLTVYLTHAYPDWEHSLLLQPGYAINPPAFVVSAGSVLLLMCGVEESKNVTNVFTLGKVLLVLFMSFGALYYSEPDNWILMTTATKQYTMTGVWRGATSSFFGYIGFDEVCCVAGEAINPAVNLPKAILYTLFIVTLLYMIAAIGLTGMVPSDQISDTSAFPDGFRYRGITWAAEICALGEIITLPLVVWVTIMAQPRLQYAMAMDGLLPPIFSKTDSSGNLYYSTLIAGIAMTLVSTFVPFVYLDDLISAGILVAFSMTDSSVILLRHTNPDEKQYLLEHLLTSFHLVSFTIGLLVSKTKNESIVIHIIMILLSLLLVWITHQIVTRCPKSCVMFGTPTNNNGQYYFQTPMVPYLPLMGIWINWYLIAQLEISGLLLLLLYMGGAVLFYFQYGVHHSIGNTRGWGSTEKRGIVPSINDGLLTSFEVDNYYHNQNDDNDDHVFLSLQPALSLPRDHYQQQQRVNEFNHRFSHLNNKKLPQQQSLLLEPQQQNNDKDVLLN